MSEGFVYFIEAEGTGYVKIGWAKHGPRVRLPELQTGCPSLLFVRAYFSGTREDERRMHETFRDLRGRGEWFTDTLKLADFLNYLDQRELGEEAKVSSLDDLVTALHDCVLTGHWYPDYPVNEKLYDDSGDWRPWRSLLEKHIGSLDYYE